MRSEIQLRLKIAQLTEKFENAIFSGIEVAHPKPAPDVFLAAAKSFNVPPSRCIVIEDSIPGITAAVRAGMRVYGHAVFTPAEALQAAGAIPFEHDGTQAYARPINNMKILETDRLLICQLTVDDANFIIELLNDPSFIQNIGYSKVCTMEDAQAYILNGPVDSYAKNWFAYKVKSSRQSDG